VRFLRGKRNKGEGIMGRVMLVNREVKMSDRERIRAVMVCKNKEKRVKALKEHFAMELTEEETQGVKGRNIELFKA
jgi:hypothetical protein